MSDRLTLHNVTLKKRNFSGIVDPNGYNDRGDRTVLVVLGQEQAEELGFDNITEMYNTLKADNWKIKSFNVTEDNDDPDAYMPCKVVYYEKNRSAVFMKTAKGSRLLNEETVGLLDSANIDIVKVDTVLKKHYYDSHGKQGWNVQVKSMEVTIEEDEICARNNY